MARKKHEDQVDELTSVFTEEPVQEVNPKQSPSPNPEGWLTIDTAPMDGTNIKISMTGKDDGIMAYWMRTRKYTNHQWHPRGRWTDPLTHRDLGIAPKFWKE